MLAREGRRVVPATELMTIVIFNVRWALRTAASYACCNCSVPVKPTPGLDCSNLAKIRAAAG